MYDFEAVYRENYPRIWKYVRSHISHLQDAEDLTADVFVYAFKNWSCYDSAKAPIHAWLYMIASSRLKNYYRDRKIFVSVDEHFSSIELIPSEDDYTKSLELMDLRELIRKLLLRLSEREREILIRRFFLSESNEQIADRLSMTAGNVRVVQMRALRKMEAWVSEEEPEG